MDETVASFKSSCENDWIEVENPARNAFVRAPLITPAPEERVKSNVFPNRRRASSNWAIIALIFALIPSQVRPNVF